MISLHDGWNGVKYSRHRLSHAASTFYHEFVLHKHPERLLTPLKSSRYIFFNAFTHKPEVEWRLLKRNRTVLVYKIKDGQRSNKLTNTAMKEGRLNWLAYQSVAQHAFVAEFPVVLCKNFSNPLQRKKKKQKKKQSKLIKVTRFTEVKHVGNFEILAELASQGVRKGQHWSRRGRSA